MLFVLNIELTHAIPFDTQRNIPNYFIKLEFRGGMGKRELSMDVSVVFSAIGTSFFIQVKQTYLGVAERSQKSIQKHNH